MKPQNDNNITNKILSTDRKYRITIRIGTTGKLTTQEDVYYTGIQSHTSTFQVYLFTRINPDNKKKNIRIASNLIENIVEIK